MDGLQEYIKSQVSFSRYQHDKHKSLWQELKVIWDEAILPESEASLHSYLKKLDDILSVSWRMIHETKDDIDIRYVYAFASVIKVFLLSILFPTDSSQDSQGKNERLQEMLTTCDMALIMSPDIQDRLLSKIAQLIHDKIPVIGNPQDDVLFVSENMSQVSLLQEVDKESSREILSFTNKYLIPGKQVMFPNFGSEWPAVDPSSGRKWTLSRLRHVAAHRTVPVEVGSKYTDEDWSQTFMTIGQFIDQVIHKNDTDLGTVKGYIAQVNLFDMIPILRKDFSLPDLTAASLTQDDEEEDNNSFCEINAWFGPEGTVSPLHFDDRDNLFVQVMGVKYIRLYSRDIPQEKIYPQRQDSLLRNTSQVDIDLLDEKEMKLYEESHLFPGFFEPDTHLFMREALLQEGDLLFIPRGTWHFVKSLSTSFSISFWWT